MECSPDVNSRYRSPSEPRPQIGNILSLIYLFLIIVQVIVNLKNKPEAVEKVGGECHGCIRLAVQPFLADLPDLTGLAHLYRAVQVHLFCTVYFMLYMVAFTGITIW